MKQFPSYKVAKLSGMTFAGLSRLGHIEATNDVYDMFIWLLKRGYTAFEASIVIEDFRL